MRLALGRLERPRHVRAELQLTGFMDEGARMPELRITHIDDVEWQEVKAQQHGDRRVSVWEKYLEWTPELMVLYARYDPGMLIERHGHKSDHIVYVLQGEITVGDTVCPPGTNLVLEHGA